MATTRTVITSNAYGDVRVKWNESFIDAAKIVTSVDGGVVDITLYNTADEVIGELQASKSALFLHADVLTITSEGWVHVIRAKPEVKL